MKSSLFIPVVSLMLFTSSCGNKPADEQKDTTVVADANGPTLEEKQRQATFIMDTQVDSMDIPRTSVTVEYHDSRTVLDPMICTPTQYNKEQYAEMEIPANAIEAFGGWFAGGGDYYYIVPTSTGIAVYKGFQDEEQEDSGYHWEKVKEIN